jgi:hypothetical protein
MIRFRTHTVLLLKTRNASGAFSALHGQANCGGDPIAHIPHSPGDRSFSSLPDIVIVATNREPWPKILTSQQPESNPMRASLAICFIRRLVISE